MFEYHQWPLVTTFGKIQTVADEFLVARLGQDRDRKRHLREGIEQPAILDQRRPLIEQVLPLENALLVDAAVDADHQIERQVDARHSARPASRRRTATASAIRRRLGSPPASIVFRIGSTDSGGDGDLARSREAARSRRPERRAA